MSRKNRNRAERKNRVQQREAPSPEKVEAWEQAHLTIPVFSARGGVNLEWEFNQMVLAETPGEVEAGLQKQVKKPTYH